MIRKSLLSITLLLLLGLFSGCTRYYTMVKQTPPTSNLKQYQTINVGWLDLGEEKYEKYGYDEKNKNKWTAFVTEMNIKSFPQSLKDFIPGKEIITAKAKNDTVSGKGLIVKFSDINYNQQTSSAAQIMFGRNAGSDTLDLTLHFIDGQSGNEIYTSTVSITSEANRFKGGFFSMGFEGRVDNAIFNLAQYISEQTN